MFHKFKYYLVDKDGKSFYIDNKVVKKSSAPKPLPQSPDGWQDINAAYERDMTKLGVVRSFTLPLSFVRFASIMLKTIAYSYSLEEIVYVLIQQLSVELDLVAQTFSMIYRYLYKGLIDFSSFSDQDVKTQVTIAEGGVAKAVKANEGTTYPIDIDSDPEVVLLKDDGTMLYDTVNFAVVSLDIPPSTGAHFIPASMVSRDGTAAGFAGFQITGPYENPVTSDNYLFETFQDITGLQLKGNIQVQLNFNAPDANGRFVVALCSNLRPGSLFNTPGIAYLNPSGHSGEPAHSVLNAISINFDLTFDASKDEKFFIYAYWAVSPVGGSSMTLLHYLDTSFTIKFGSRYKTTWIKCLKLSTLGKRITKFVTGNESDLDTTFLEQNDNLIFTSGDGMRSLAGAKIQMSLADYTTLNNVINFAGQGIEQNKLLFALKDHFLKITNPVALGGVSNFKTYTATDFRFNTVKIGYEAQQIDNVNGKYSFHNSHTYQLPTAPVDPKVLDLVTKVILCCYYQEIIRINLDGKTTTDNTLSDNSVFGFDAEKTALNINPIFDVVIDTDITGDYFYIKGLDDSQIEILKASFIAGGSISNNGRFTVKSIVAAVDGYKIYVFQPIVPETVSGLTITIEYYTLLRENYSQIQGVPDNTVYNVRYSPKRLLLKHSKWINSICYNLAGQKAVFLTTEKNADLITALNGVVIEEKGSYTVTQDILFKPFYHEFDCITPIDLIYTMETDINTPFLPTWYGDDYLGFLVKGGTALNDHKSQSYKLLAGPNSDLTRLIF